MNLCQILGQLLQGVPVPELPSRCLSNTRERDHRLVILGSRIIPNCAHSFQWNNSRVLFSLAKRTARGCPATQILTFGDAECVVTACYKVVKCNKEVGIALGGSQQVLLGAPPNGFVQCLGFNVATIGAVQGL